MEPNQEPSAAPTEPSKAEPKQEKPVFYKKELILALGAIILLSLLFSCLSLIYKTPASDATNWGEIAKIKFDWNFMPYTIGFAVGDGIIITVLILFGRLMGQEKPILNKARPWITYAILFILGLAAYIVMVVGLRTIPISFFAAVLIANLIYSVYLYLMAKLYFFGYVYDKRIFYEVVRFALVGVIASIFDLTTCYLFEFVILPQTWPSIWLTIVSVTMGFIIGVTVNYLCSVYMVFKATTEKDKSRTAWGRVLFVILAAVGLFIGYGLQYLFYDYLKVGYVTTFIIRTLIVLIWNYFSRKYLIFR